jgi:hypothetical protein
MQATHARLLSSTGQAPLTHAFIHLHASNLTHNFPPFGPPLLHALPAGLAPVYLLDFIKLSNVLEIRGSCGNSLRDFLQDAQW